MARPLARFKDSEGNDFQTEWRPYELSSLVNRITRKNLDNQTNLPLTMSAREGLIAQDTYFNKTVASSDLTKYTLLYQGEFAYNHSSSKGYDYGAIHRLTKHPCGAVTPLYFCFGIKDQAGVDPDFLAYYFESQKWTREVASVCSKGARQHGALNISVEDFFSIIVYLPSIEEQHQVAHTMAALDNTIDCMTSIVAAWEQRKLSVAHKLFAQEVRFKADDGSTFPKWELVRIGDVGCFIGGLSFKSSAVVESDGIAVLTATNVGSDGTLDYNHNVLLVAKEAKAHQYLQPNDVVVCKSNGSQHLVGKAAKYDGGYHGPKGITVGAFCGIFRSTSPIIPYWFQSEDYHDLLKNSRQGGDGSLLNIKGSDIENHYAMLPSSPEEQCKIADCLGTLDEVIALAKAELEKWRELKKGLLQQLFV